MGLEQWKQRKVDLVEKARMRRFDRLRPKVWNETLIEAQRRARIENALEHEIKPDSPTDGLLDRFSRRVKQLRKDGTIK